MAMAVLGLTDLKWLTGAVRSGLFFLAFLTLLIVVQALPAPAWWPLTQTDREIAR